jgi:hypothetical protein
MFEESLTPLGKGRERGWPEAMPYVKRPLDRNVRLGRKHSSACAADTLI